MTDRLVRPRMPDRVTRERIRRAVDEYRRRRNGNRNSLERRYADLERRVREQAA